MNNGSHHTGKFNPLLWSVHLNISGRDFFSATAGIPTSLSHETFHAEQYIGTTVGCWLGVLDVLEGFIFKAYLEECEVMGDPIPNALPFLETLSETPLAKDRIFGDRQVANVWKSIKAIKYVLLGESYAPNKGNFENLYAAWRNVFAILSIFSDNPNFRQTQKLLEKVFNEHKGAIIPSAGSILYEDFGIPHHLGMDMIMENAAVLQTVKESRGRSELINSMRRQYPPFYTCLIPLIVGPYMYLDHLPNSFNIYKTTALAAFDLALMTPLIPGYDRVFEQAKAWKDLHPGYRILTIGKILTKNKIPPVIDVDQDYDPFIEAVCHYAQWPTPKEIAAIIVASSHEHLSILGMSEHVKRFLMACKARINNGYVIGVPNEQSLMTDEEIMTIYNPITSYFFSDGEYLILDPEVYQERLPIYVWNWITNKFMLSDKLNLDHCDLFGDSPSLMKLGKQIVRNYLKLISESDLKRLGIC